VILVRKKLISVSILIDFKSLNKLLCVLKPFPCPYWPLSASTGSHPLL